MGKIFSTIVEVLPAVVAAVGTWLIYKFFGSELTKLVVFAASASTLLWPVNYRKTDAGMIRIPYLFVGFCELAIIVFDRFKPTSSP